MRAHLSDVFAILRYKRRPVGPKGFEAKGTRVWRPRCVTVGPVRKTGFVTRVWQSRSRRALGAGFVAGATLLHAHALWAQPEPDGELSSSSPTTASPGTAEPVAPSVEAPAPEAATQGAPPTNGDTTVEVSPAHAASAQPVTTLTQPGAAAAEQNAPAAPTPVPPAAAGNLAPEVNSPAVVQPSPAIAPEAPALTPGWSWVDTVAAAPPPKAIAPKRNPFRGSRFDWTHNVTTSALGIGQDYQSSAYQSYQQGFSLLLAYFPYDGDTFRVRVGAAPGMDLVLTNSDVTSRVREPWFRDLPLLVGGSVIVSMQPERLMSTILAPNLLLFLPTSKMSWNSGDYLTVSPRVSVSQQLPLFGAGAAAFDDVDLWLQLRYDRLFSRGATAIDADLDRPRTNGQGGTTYSDVLDGSQNAPNAFRIDLAVVFSEELFGRPLMLSVNADYRLAQLYGVSPYTVQTATGSVLVEPDPDARTWRSGVGFGLDATYQLARTTSVALGYAACGNEVCPGRGADLGNATYRTPFYTAHAIFWAGLIVHVDTVLDLLINGDKTNSSVLRRDLAGTKPLPRF